MWIDVGLFLLCILVAVLAVTFVQHLFLTVPFVPTPPQVVDAMLDAAHLRGHETVYDLGAGDARLLIEAKKRFPGITTKGCELVWAVWLLGKFRIWRAGVPVSLTRESVFTIDCSDADVVFLYLFPSMLQKLEKRFDALLKPGTVVASHAFRFPGREAAESRTVGGKTVYVYRWN